MQCQWKSTASSVYMVMVCSYMQYIVRIHVATLTASRLHDIHYSYYVIAST